MLVPLRMSFSNDEVDIHHHLSSMFQENTRKEVVRAPTKRGRIQLALKKSPERALQVALRRASSVNC